MPVGLDGDQHVTPRWKTLASFYVWRRGIFHGWMGGGGSHTNSHSLESKGDKLHVVKGSDLWLLGYLFFLLVCPIVVGHYALVARILIVLSASVSYCCRTHSLTRTLYQDNTIKLGHHSQWTATRTPLHWRVLIQWRKLKRSINDHQTSLESDETKIVSSVTIRLDRLCQGPHVRMYIYIQWNLS